MMGEAKEEGSLERGQKDKLNKVWKGVWTSGHARDGKHQLGFRIC